MYGAAPKMSRVGSQVERVTKSFRPVWEIAGAPMRHSSPTITAATSSTPRPSAVSRIAHARSGRLTRAGAASGARPGSPAASVRSLAGSEDGLSIHGHPLERLLDLVDYRPGQRRIVESRGVLLPVVLGPPDELEERIAFGDVLLVAIDEQVSESGDRIGLRARLIGDRDAVVVRHRGPRRCRGDGFHRRLDPLSVVVPQGRGGQLVLVRIRELHVADRAFRLLDHPGDALVSLSPQTGRPVHAGALPRPRLPLG